jgi:integrase
MPGAILSLEEITRLLEAAPGPEYKAALSAAYAAGLRVSEVVALKVSDIDSDRLLRIEQGKDRFAMLPPKLLELLRKLVCREWVAKKCARTTAAAERDAADEMVATVPTSMRARLRNCFPRPSRP